MAAIPKARGTATSRFGVSRRESHDASEFYARFRAPEVSGDDQVAGPVELGEPLRCADSRALDLPDGCAALVVTSPPYFAGKEYETALGEGAVPASYLEYLGMLRDVFAECRRVLEPGGRIAVNVANLGRKPYRSLSADVIRILQDDLGLLLRGEVIWVKAEGASGNCAWGSFRSPANPVLRDVTERVVIASKGRFDRARPAARRRAEGLPHRSTLTNDEFLDSTLDLWRIPAESARRVGHPAPFPVELPLRLIELYTYAGDLVLDPFLGSGSAAVAAVRAGRRYAGYDIDPEYVATARARVEEEQARLRAATADGGGPEAWGRTEGEGRAASALAEGLLEEAGFTVTHRNRSLPALGTTVSLVGRAADGREWWFDVTGGFTTVRGGLARADVLWRALGRAHVLRAAGASPLVLLTSHLPASSTPGESALRAVGPEGLFDVVAMGPPAGRERLAAYARGGHDRPLPGFWSPGDLAR
ncbi:MAG TPA: site-specific DNA-methyltransferase [Acidimicrobiia bacterium]|nr:site-specific DNA-methyltransferase [Acidimicrobiia bacterium]